MAKRRPPKTILTARPAVGQNGHADPDEVTAAAEEVDTVYLECRVGLRHAWDDLGSYFTEDGTIAQRARCFRCPTEKLTEYTMDGGLLGSKYVYPEGFQLKGLGRMNVDGNRAQRRVLIGRKRITKRR